jgi:type I restriction enzyme, S subunit
LLEGWHETQLRDVCRFNYGKGLPKRDRSGTGHPVIGAAGIVDLHDVALVKGPVIVVGRKGSAGAIVYVESDCWPIDTTYWVEVEPGADQRFLRYLLENLELSRFVTTTAIPGLNRDTVLDAVVKLPPMAEQRRIGDVLEQVDAAIKKLLGEANSLAVVRDSALTSLLAPAEEWPTAPLDGLIELHDRSRVPIKADDRNPGPYPYCGANGVVDHIDDFRYDGEYLLIAEDGGYWGPNDPSAYAMSGKFWVNNHAHVLTSDGGLDQTFLRYALIHTDIRPWVTGTTRGKLTTAALKQVRIPMPPVDKQLEIAALATSIEVARESVLDEKMRLENLRAALLSSLVSGERRVPDSYDRFLADENPDDVTLEPATV